MLLDQMYIFKRYVLGDPNFNHHGPCNKHCHQFPVSKIKVLKTLAHVPGSSWVVRRRHPGPLGSHGNFSSRWLGGVMIRDFMLWSIMINSSWILIEQWRQLTASVYKAFDHCSTAVAAWRPGFQSTVFQASICQRRRSWIFSLYSNFMAPVPCLKNNTKNQLYKYHLLYSNPLCNKLIDVVPCVACIVPPSSRHDATWSQNLASLFHSGFILFPRFKLMFHSMYAPEIEHGTRKWTPGDPFASQVLPVLPFGFLHHFQRCTPCIASQCCQRISISHPPPIRSL